jgi:dienelactone hydrolase
VLSDLELFDEGEAPGTGSRPTGTFPATIHALVRYPATAAGVDTPVSTVQPSYPLIVIAHGNHRVLDGAGAPVESFRGLEYLARHLASHGYIAISVDLDVVNAPILTIPSDGPRIAQRGLIILEHINFWKNTLNSSDPLFTGKIDTARIGLIGHSRGGEAVVSAQRTNLDESRGFDIKAVTSISQTDFLGIVLTATPYLVIYGSADHDVKRGSPFRLYDRAAPFKSLLFVYGAIHNRFSTSPDWLAHLDLNPAIDARIISADNHLNSAKGYCLGFMELMLRGVSSLMVLFKNNVRPSAVSASVEIHAQIQDAPPRLSVDDFEQGAFSPGTAHGPQLAARATTNTLGQTVTQAGLAVPAPVTTNPPVNTLTHALTEGSLRHRDLDFFWNDTFGQLLAWDAAGATYTQPLGTQDVASFSVLSFRVTQRYKSPRNPLPPSPSPEFSVALADSASRTATVRVGGISAIPVPYVRVDDESLTKSALATIRIPLSAFTDVNASLDLHSLQTVIFQFVQTAQGEVAIDDLEFSN